VSPAVCIGFVKRVWEADLCRVICRVMVQVHELGHREVAKIQAEMMKVSGGDGRML
jgi:hypothetical protein